MLIGVAYSKDDYDASYVYTKVYSSDVRNIFDVKEIANFMDTKSRMQYLANMDTLIILQISRFDDIGYITNYYLSYKVAMSNGADIIFVTNSDIYLPGAKTINYMKYNPFEINRVLYDSNIKGMPYLILSAFLLHIIEL